MRMQPAIRANEEAARPYRRQLVAWTAVMAACAIGAAAIIRRDVDILHYVNSFSGRSQTADLIVHGLVNSNLTKGLLFVSIMWWLWTKDEGKLISADNFFIRSAIGLIAAILIGRVLQVFLPWRLRPLDDPSLGLVVPLVEKPEAWQRWSSFPSDHAVVFFALSTLIWSRNRALGYAAYAWSMIIILLPRLYFGLHYPTDILGGAVVGTLVIVLINRASLPAALIRGAKYVQQAHPGLLFALVFFASAEFAMMFDDVRDLLKGAAGIAGHLLKGPQ